MIPIQISPADLLLFSLSPSLIYRVTFYDCPSSNYLSFSRSSNFSDKIGEFLSLSPSIRWKTPRNDLETFSSPRTTPVEYFSA